MWQVYFHKNTWININHNTPVPDSLSYSIPSQYLDDTAPKKFVEPGSEQYTTSMLLVAQTSKESAQITNNK